MILGSLPFVLYFAMVRGNPRALVRDTQVQWFIATVIVSILLVAFWLVTKNDIDVLRALRLSSFNVVSIITGTGYASADYNAWGVLPVTAFFFFMFIGGCAGSTSCGIKIFRYQILFANIRVQFRRLWQPNVVYSPRYNRKPIPESVTDAVMSFFFLFALVFGILALVLTLIGLDFMTAVSGAATAIANVGPALGPTIGPSGTFAPLPDAAKWTLSIGMLLGRLELFTVLVLFSPAFWRA
jgi:trk system potassium uptake protein